MCYIRHECVSYSPRVSGDGHANVAKESQTHQRTAAAARATHSNDHHTETASSTTSRDPIGCAPYGSRFVLGSNGVCVFRCARTSLPAGPEPASNPRGESQSFSRIDGGGAQHCCSGASAREFAPCRSI